jgi:hypothetical protein
MKKYVVFAIVTLFVASISVMAQGPREGRGPQGEKPGKHMMLTPQQRLDQLAKHVELTDAEKARVLELFVKQDEKRDAIQKEFKKLKEKGEAERKAAEEDLKKIIGSEKYIQLQAERIEHLKKMNQKMMKHKMMQRRFHGEGPGRMPEPEAENK